MASLITNLPLLFLICYFNVMFLKNIEALKLYNPKLALKLENYTFDKAREVIDIAKSKSDDIIFIKNNIPLESIENPVEETFYNVQSNIKTNLEKFDFIVMFGLGVGYMLDYVFEKYNSRLVVLEPDLNVLRVAFELVDYAKYLNTGRVFITDNFDEVYNFISQKYIVNDRVEILILKQYLSMYSEQIKDFTNQIYETCLVKMSDVNTIKQNSELWVDSSLEFIKNCGQTYPISLLDNAFEDRVALIVGAGPGLKDDIELIKQHRDKYIVFAVNRSLQYLAENEIVPNFVIFTDTKFVKYTVNKDVLNLKYVNFVVDIKADSYVYNLVKKRCFTYYPENFEFAKILSEKNSHIKLYETAGTATFCALNCAKNLGIKTIILSGCDLALRDNEIYCGRTSLTEVNDKEVRQGSMIKKIVPVKSITGKMVNTREDYAIFIKHFEWFLKKNPQLKVYNTSDFGANIEGAQNVNMKNLMDIIPPPTSTKTSEDIIIETLFNTKFNPLELKKLAKKIALKEQEQNFKLRADIKMLMEQDLNDDLFLNRALKILEKISETIFLAQSIQFELLACTKNLTLKDIVIKRAKLELFFEETFDKLDKLIEKTAKII